jgi:hypothetical protein
VFQQRSIAPTAQRMKMKMKVDEIALCADAGAQLDLNVALL